MPGETLTLACSPYDRMLPLALGEIGIAGADLRFVPMRTPTDIFNRMVDRREFDAAEMSLSEAFVLGAKGAAPFVSLPVFPSRMFRHGFVFINAQAGIRGPRDLAGKRIGIQRLHMTAAIWIRGMLRSEYGVNFNDVHWVEGGVNTPGTPGGKSTKPAPGERLSISLVQDRSLNDMLAEGTIDAMIGAWIPDAFGKHPDVRRLFPDYHARERDYYRRTGIFPIMHNLVLRHDVHLAHPDMARRLFDACDAAKALARQHQRISGALPVMLPWLVEQLEEIDALFGADFWPYGLAANRATLQAFGQMLVDEHLITAVPALDHLFLPLEPA